MTPGRLPHPLILLLVGVGIAAVLTWILPAGNFERKDDPATGRRVVVAGTYHRVDRAPVGPFGAAVAVPRGFVAGADVIAVVLFVGGAWVVVDKLGTLPALVGVLVARFRRRRLWAIPVIGTFFAVMGALENMQEEIIPLVPVLLVLGEGLGVDAVAVVAMSAGAAMIGSAFGPTNPFQAGIALKLAQLPPLAAGGLRLAMFVVAVAAWIGWILRHATARPPSPPVRPPSPSVPTSVPASADLRPAAGRPPSPDAATSVSDAAASVQQGLIPQVVDVRPLASAPPSPGAATSVPRAPDLRPSASRPPSPELRPPSPELRPPSPDLRPPSPTLPARHALILVIALAPMAAYVYGALRLDWGFNELSGAFLIAAMLAGLVGGLGIGGTLTAYLEGAQALLPAALMIGAARSISLVLDDGHVVDTILNSLAAALVHAPGALSAFLQIAAHAVIHVAVPSVSGQAVLTMPLFVPLADLLGLSRQVPVLAYQTGAGLTELVTPTNGALMAVLLAAGVPFERWIRFVIGGALIAAAIGAASIAAVMWLGL